MASPTAGAGLPRTVVSSPLSGERCTLTAALEPRCSRRSPAQDIAIDVGDRHEGVVECRFDVRNTPRHITTNLLLFSLPHDDSPDRATRSSVNSLAPRLSVSRLLRQVSQLLLVNCQTDLFQILRK